MNYILKMLKIAYSTFKQKNCQNCEIFREFLLSLFKMLRNIKEEAEKEGFEKILRLCERVEKALLTLLVWVLSKQGVSVLVKED